MLRNRRKWKVVRCEAGERILETVAFLALIFGQQKI
jgi:hypothetical protein